VYANVFDDKMFNRSAVSGGCPFLLRLAFIALADLHGRSDPALTAMSINHSIGITARNELISCINAGMKPGEQTSKADELDTVFESLSISESKPSFELEPDLDLEVQRFSKHLKSVPPHWAVVTFALSNTSSDDVRLLACRTQAGRNALVLSLTPTGEELDAVFSEFDSIIAESKASTNASQEEVDPKQW
jgi:hypothetical protein